MFIKKSDDSGDSPAKFEKIAALSFFFLINHFFKFSNFPLIKKEFLLKLLDF